MPQSKRSVMSEDTTALPQATQSAMNEYARSFGRVSVGDMIQLFGGSKSDLAQALAGTSDKSSTAYKSQQKNISRWLNYENGIRGPQARNPNNATTRGKFQSLFARESPPNSANITMTGWIGYDAGGSKESWRYRTVGSPKPIRLSGGNLASFLSALNRGDTSAAYRQIFTSYGAPSLTMGADDNPQISITFGRS